MRNASRCIAQRRQRQPSPENRSILADILEFHFDFTAGVDGFPDGSDGFTGSNISLKETTVFPENLCTGVSGQSLKPFVDIDKWLNRQAQIGDRNPIPGLVRSADQ